MQYFIAFLEGIITFVSPCLLPMIPIYISYFAAGENSRKKTIINALGFVLGFSIVFILLGAFAGSIGQLLMKYQTAVNVVTGLIVVSFGLHYIGAFRIAFLDKTRKKDYMPADIHFGSSVLFGLIFSIGWTPCVGVFLGSALMLASVQSSMGKGIGMLICYSIGLGVPFLLSAILLDRLKGTFQFIKKHYGIINKISGIFLVITGICMMFGWLNKLLSVMNKL